MNQRPDNSDAALSKALKHWHVDAPLPPGFQQSVWQKIGQATAPIHHSVFELFRYWMTGAILRPHIAATYLAALLMIGITVGWTQGQRDSLRVQNELAERYVRSLDPYLAPRS